MNEWEIDERVRDGRIKFEHEVREGKMYATHTHAQPAESVSRHIFSLEFILSLLGG